MWDKLLLLLLALIPADADSFQFNEYLKNSPKEFHQINQVFWKFNEETGSWVKLKLPYDLVSCTDHHNCKVVASIRESKNETESNNDDDHHSSKVGDSRTDSDETESDSDAVEREKKKRRSRSSSNLRRISLTRISESSIWITGPSGSIYERSWNGIQWVLAPRSLPFSAGYAVSVFKMHHTILALSESGLLYQIVLNRDLQPLWVGFKPEFENGTGRKPAEEQVHISALQFSSEFTSDGQGRALFCTKQGFLVELIGVIGPSDTGYLYEYDQMTRPSWKKHVNLDDSRIDGSSLAVIRPCSVHGLMGAHSFSIFLLTQKGELVERRLQQRKWKWIVHGNPKGHMLTSITCISQKGSSHNSNSLFLATALGSIFEYHIQKDTKGTSDDQESDEKWVNHKHPPEAKVARNIEGLPLQEGRTLFPLDDGRIGELHFPGYGGENAGLNPPISSRRKSQSKYVWSLLDAPETEGWNGEYCSGYRGPSNCIVGTKDGNIEASSFKWRKDSRTQQTYILPSLPDGKVAAKAFSSLSKNQTAVLFRLRSTHLQDALFLISDTGLTLEYLNPESKWQKHAHANKMQGILGYYNGSLFVVDEQGSLLIRAIINNKITWTNCTAMKKGQKVISSRPWDWIPGRRPIGKPEDAVFFVSKSGKLQQLSVASSNYKWKDCKNPPGIRIASIVDEELFRENIIFVVGKNGKLYQYNKITEIWHEHHQSHHLILSRSPGTIARPVAASLKGSLFMLSEEGGLVEYRWSTEEGWNWIEHGTPGTKVNLIGAPGPCFRGRELFFVGSDGNVYLRVMDQEEWIWIDCGFPDDESINEEKHGDDESSADEICHPEVASTRPISFFEDAVLFQLKDGRLAEMSRTADQDWRWSRIIGTPTSLCAARSKNSMAL